LLALLGSHHILYVSRIRVKERTQVSLVTVQVFLYFLLIYSFTFFIYYSLYYARGKAMANYPQELAQDAVCQSHTGHMTGLWFLPIPAFKAEY